VVNGDLLYPSGIRVGSKHPFCVAGREKTVQLFLHLAHVSRVGLISTVASDTLACLSSARRHLHGAGWRCG
jgi:hypothetical protein